MRRLCLDCGRHYDDVEFSTLCPHDPIDGNYCRICDVFCCERHPAKISTDVAESGKPLTFNLPSEGNDLNGIRAAWNALIGEDRGRHVIETPAYLRIHEQPNYVSDWVERTFEWQGARTARVYIQASELERWMSLAFDRHRQMPARLRIGPFALRRVSFGDEPPHLYLPPGAWYVLDDAGLWNWLRHHLGSWLNWRGNMVYRRTVLCLAIWGLADVPMGEMPHWSQIKAIRWFRDETHRAEGGGR